MTIKLTTLKQSLNAAYRLVKPQRSAIDKFKDGLNTLLQRIDVEESEENVMIHLMDFPKNTWHSPDYLIATKGITDFVIHTNNDTMQPAKMKSTISVDTIYLEKQIDDLVYRLYNLTPEEIQIIESSVK